MLKPSSTTVIDQDYVEYYPHIVFLHNKAELQDFMPVVIDEMKVLYSVTYGVRKLATSKYVLIFEIVNFHPMCTEQKIKKTLLSSSPHPPCLQ